MNVLKISKALYFISRAPSNSYIINFLIFYFYIQLCVSCVCKSGDHTAQQSDPSAWLHSLCYLTWTCSHTHQRHTHTHRYTHANATRPQKINVTGFSRPSVYTSPLRLSPDICSITSYSHTHTQTERERRPPHGRPKPLWAIWNVVGAGETRYCWLCHIAFAATRQERVCLTARRYDSVSHPPAQQQAVGQRGVSEGGGVGGQTLITAGRLGREQSCLYEKMIWFCVKLHKKHCVCFVWFLSI